MNETEIETDASAPYKKSIHVYNGHDTDNSLQVYKNQNTTELDISIHCFNGCTYKYNLPANIS
jgi:hypothetical protein